MKFKNVFLLIVILISFNSCMESIERVQHGEVVHPEYLNDKEDLKARIQTLVPAEQIHISTSRTTASGKPEVNTIQVEILHPNTFPQNGAAFSTVAGDIQEAVEQGIDNISDYQKMVILIKNTVVEDQTQHERTYKKEFSL